MVCICYLKCCPYKYALNFADSKKYVTCGLKMGFKMEKMNTSNIFFCELNRGRQPTQLKFFPRTGRMQSEKGR